MSNLDPKNIRESEFKFDIVVPDHEYFMAPQQRITVNLGGDDTLVSRRQMGVPRGEEVMEVLEGEVNIRDIVF